MSANKIKVLIADDSGLMRLLVSDMLSADEEIEVIGTASDGKEAFEKTEILRPDVVVLDLMMPDYDGFYATRQIMHKRPVPIVILSSLATDKAKVSEDILEAGAYDFVTKPAGVLSPAVREVKTELIRKVKEAARAGKGQFNKRIRRTSDLSMPFAKPCPYGLVVLAVSTGGIGLVENILMRLPLNFPVPVVVVQHFPAGNYSHKYAERLRETTGFEVSLASDELVLQAGRIYFAVPGMKNTFSRDYFGEIRFELDTEEKEIHPTPSADITLKSASEVYGKKTIGLILSGMGSDGSEGIVAVHGQGGLTLAQDSGTSVVFGMPDAAAQTGIIDDVLSAGEIAPYLVRAMQSEAE